MLGKKSLTRAQEEAEHQKRVSRSLMQSLEDGQGATVGQLRQLEKRVSELEVAMEKLTKKRRFFCSE